MKTMKKYIILSMGAFIIALSILPIFASASYPPEWIVASDARITIGTQVGGTYENTFYYDLSYHTIQCERGGFWGDWHARVYYEFGGKCSRVQIFTMVDPLIYGNCFSARAYYTDGTYEFLGYFNPNSFYTFNLNSGKYIDEIRIDYYLGWNIIPCERYIKIDYIRCYWTGRL